MIGILAAYRLGMLASLPEPKPDRQKEPRQTQAGGLSPKQIAWCRKNINAFDEAWTAATAADLHAIRVRAQLEKNASPQ